jgi:hypothetical protein
VLPDDLQRARRILRRDKGNEAPLVGDLQRIQPQHFAGGVNVLADGNGLLLNGDFHARIPGNFVQRARQAAARQIAETVNFNSRLQQRQHRLGHRRGIAFNRAFKFQALAHGHDRHAMPAQIAAQKHRVAGRTLAGKMTCECSMTPRPAVLMYSPSPLPLSTTFVSPVTICTPHFFAASRIEQTTRHRVSIGSPSSMMNALVRYSGRAPLIARSFTVP